MGILSQPDPKRVVAALKALGWSYDHTRGSHQYFIAPGRPTLSVPIHKGRAMKQGTLRGILRQAGIGVEDFLRVY